MDQEGNGSLIEAHKETLRNFGWLGACRPAFQDEFLEIGRLRRLDSGAELYREGQVSTHVYGWIEGQVDVRLTSPSGEVLVYPFTAPGRWYGLADVVAGMPAYGTATAATSSLTYCISRREIIGFLEADSERYQSIIAHEFALRRNIQETVVDLVTSDGLELVARRLVRMMEFGGIDLLSGWKISQIEFATAAGVSVPTVQRAFKELKRVGAIETSYGKIVVKDVGRLKAFVETISG